MLGADGDVATQVSQVQDLIAADVDYLVIGPVDGTAIVPAVKEAHEAGVKVIIIGNVIDPAGDDYITAVRVPDDYAMGKDSAELMIEALGGEGRIFVIEGLPGQPAVIARLEAYDDVFGETDIEVVDSQPANWDSTKAVEYHLNISGRLCRSRDFHIAPALRGMETSATLPHIIEKIRCGGHRGFADALPRH